jgi:hypothetical protein
MKKVDLKKQLKSLYNPPAKDVSEIVVPAMNFIMIDGKGDPNKAPQFQAAIEALYPVSYAIKFDFKKNRGVDYPVMALEGLWWADNMDDFTTGDRDNWLWTLMIMQPDFVTEEIYKQNLQAVKKKKNLPALEKLRFEKFDEGRSAQIMHIGPFSTEGANIAKIHEFIKSRSGKMIGKHHEIYLSDFRRVAPDKMKTVLRQPFK